MKYYHGGVGGLMVGNYLLPPSITGVKTHLDMLKECGIDRFAHVKESEDFLSHVGITGIWRPDRVYLGGAMGLHFILGYAALNSIADYRDGNGAVYEAIPEGDVNVFCMGDWLRSVGLGHTVKQTHDNYVRVECERAMIYNVIVSDVDESYADRFQPQPAYVTRAVNDRLSGKIDRDTFIQRYAYASHIPSMDGWDDASLIPDDILDLIPR